MWRVNLAVSAEGVLYVYYAHVVEAVYTPGRL